MSTRLTKYGALVALVAQNSIGVIGVRFSRLSDGPMYLVSSAIFTTEILKFIFCLCAVFAESGSPAGFARALRLKLTAYEMLRLAVPAFLFLVQNNLVYFAVSNMDAAVFSVVYQSKLLTTAMFSMCILQKRFSWTQWASLLVLAAGVALTQYQPEDGDGASAHTKMRDSAVGLIATLSAALLSGFSSVYMESILKGADTSIWMRNVQMGFSSIPLAVASMLLTKDRHVLNDHGLFYGYTNIVILIVVNQAVGGILVATVMKYADNILKGFAVAVSLVVTVGLNTFIFESTLTTHFVIAVGCVSVSLFMYSMCGPSPTPVKKGAKMVQPLQKRMLPADDRFIMDDEESQGLLVEMR